MYKEFFNLRENPFNVNPDPRYLVPTPSMQEALAGLTYGIQSRKGIILLTGEVGTGKTTLLNVLMEWLRQARAATAFIFNTRLSVSDLFDCVMGDFGIAVESHTKSEALMRLNAWLLERYQAKEPAVLVVDEAQNLTLQLLDEIRFLINETTTTEKLLQIVLSGQPELEEKLRRPQLRQLRQRIAVRCRTSQMSLEETHRYVAERLHIAGANGQPIFSPEAIESIHNYACGVPRVINVLCENALINAFVEQRRPVPPRLIDEVAREFELDQVAPNVLPLDSAIPESSQAAKALFDDFVRNRDRSGQHEPEYVEPRAREL